MTFSIDEELLFIYFANFLGSKYLAVSLFNFYFLEADDAAVSISDAVRGLKIFYLSILGSKIIFLISVDEPGGY